MMNRSKRNRMSRTSIAVLSLVLFLGGTAIYNNMVSNYMDEENLLLLEEEAPSSLRRSKNSEAIKTDVVPPSTTTTSSNGESSSDETIASAVALAAGGDADYNADDYIEDKQREAEARGESAPGNSGSTTASASSAGQSALLDPCRSFPLMKTALEGIEALYSKILLHWIRNGASDVSSMFEEQWEIDKASALRIQEKLRRSILHTGVLNIRIVGNTMTKQAGVPKYLHFANIVEESLVDIFSLLGVRVRVIRDSVVGSSALTTKVPENSPVENERGFPDAWCMSELRKEAHSEVDLYVWQMDYSLDKAKPDTTLTNVESEAVETDSTTENSNSKSDNTKRVPCDDSPSLCLAESFVRHALRSQSNNQPLVLILHALPPSEWVSLSPTRLSTTDTAVDDSGSGSVPTLTNTESTPIPNSSEDVPKPIQEEVVDTGLLKYSAYGVHHILPEDGLVIDTAMDSGSIAGRSKALFSLEFWTKRAPSSVLRNSRSSKPQNVEFGYRTHEFVGHSVVLFYLRQLHISLHGLCELVMDDEEKKTRLENISRFSTLVEMHIKRHYATKAKAKEERKSRGEEDEKQGKHEQEGVTTELETITDDETPNSGQSTVDQIESNGGEDIPTQDDINDDESIQSKGDVDEDHDDDEESSELWGTGPNLSELSGITSPHCGRTCSSSPQSCMMLSRSTEVLPGNSSTSWIRSEYGTWVGTQESGSLDVKLFSTSPIERIVLCQSRVEGLHSGVKGSLHRAINATLNGYPVDVADDTKDDIVRTDGNDLDRFEFGKKLLDAADVCVVFEVSAEMLIQPGEEDEGKNVDDIEARPDTLQIQVGEPNTFVDLSLVILF